MKLEIRKASPEDVPVITELYNGDTNLFGENGTGYEERDLLEYINDPRKSMFLSVLNGEVVGALLAEYHDTYAYLDTIVVKKELQGKGIGRFLMETFEEETRQKGIHLIETLTEVNNKRMQNLFNLREYNKGNTFIFYSKKLG